MADLSTIFEKLEKNCSNTYLIDEELCLANSYKIIDTNFTNLSSAVYKLQTTSDYLNSVYTLFANNSAAWYKANSNLKANTQTWNNDFTLVKTLSSTWANEISLFYTTIYEIQDWYTKEATSTYSNGQIKNWLNNNFPTKNFSNEQILTVYVNLYENFSFDMTNFSATYYHDCHVPKRVGSISCTPCPRPSRGCNHHGGNAGYGPCTNAYDGCSVRVVGSDNVSYTCQGSGAKTMKLPSDGGKYSTYLTDRFTVRNVRLRYYKANKNDNSWTKLS